MNNIDALTQHIAKFPGIGPRQARRIVFFLLASRHSWIQKLIDLLQTVIISVHKCNHCLGHFEAEGNTDTCGICLTSDKTKLMLVEKETDLENIKKLGIYTGRYFILGSLLPITSKKNLQNMNTESFIKEVKRAIYEEGLNEIILALPVSTEGDHTADYIKSELVVKNNISITISLLGRGLSTGTELEYSDDETFKSAFETRIVK